MQFCIENLDQAGGCTYNYSCAYTDSISWASPNEPLPMIRDPRVAFDLLFGAGGTAEDRASAPREPPQHPRLDRRARSPTVRQDLGAERPRAPRPATSTTSARSSAASRPSKRRTRSGEERELPEAPDGRAGLVLRAHEADVRPAGAGAPDRHDARHLVQDRPRLARTACSRRAASSQPFHPASHHGNREDRVLEFNKITQVPRQPAALLPREAEDDDGRRAEPARQDDDRLRLADGRRQRPQPPPLPARAAGPRATAR